MRASTYEIILPLIGCDDQPVAGKALLINGLYGAVDVVDAETAERLRSGDCAELSLAERERLANRGHITRRTEADELADAQLLGRIYERTVGRISVGPVILPTHDCNFRCPYCFEKHRLSRGRDWLRRVMQPEMVEAVFAALKKLREKGYRMDSCGLYGGEPLLKENIATVRDICDHAREMGLSLTAITNGYDLDAYIDLLQEYDFKKLQITVDGVGEINDRRRKHRDGLPTYDRIMENVALALEYGIDVDLRVNVNRENIGGIEALIDDMATRGLRPLAAETRLRSRGKAAEPEITEQSSSKRCGIFNYYFKAISEPLDSLTRVTERQIMDAILATGMPSLEAIMHQSQYSFFIDDLWGAMEKELFPGVCTAFCGAESGALVIDPDGQLHTCWDLVAIDAESVGMTDVSEKRFLYNFNKARWRLRTSDRMLACQKCPHIFICRGGCAVEAKREHESYFRESCWEFRETFAFTASRLAGRKWEETAADELTLSRLGPLSRLTASERERLTTGSSPKEMLLILQDVGLFPEGSAKITE